MGNLLTMEWKRAMPCLVKESFPEGTKNHVLEVSIGVFLRWV